MHDTPKIRLYVDHPLADGEDVSLSRAQAHYLFAVMRLRCKDQLCLINGRDGAWRGVVTQADKRGGTLQVVEQLQPMQFPPDLWLLFAPIKKARTDFIVEKAAEMGAARICPVQTAYTNAERVRHDRLQAHAIEAIEQCGGTFVPEVAELAPLDQVLRDWPNDRRLVFADETLAGSHAILQETDAKKWAVLIGPEGGFAAEERSRLLSLPFVSPVSLGPRILRADTAAVAALTLIQSIWGDWT
ncbi:MAG: 16S rRNA (uracil(1498)-N(3))-methyltransferase [Pseudomonadota bacterium]